MNDAQHDPAVLADGSLPITVAIPCFNCTRTIERALASVAAQTQKPAEVVIVDDASTDGSWETLRALQRRCSGLPIRLQKMPVNRGPASTRNVAWDLAPHDISIILHIMGKNPESVNCQGEKHIHRQIEDVTNMSLNFSNGGFATILSSWLDPNKVRRMTFVGSKKMILYDDNETNEKIRIYDKHVEMPAYYDTFGEFNYAYHYGDMYSPYIRQEEPLKVQCQHFIDCIKNRTACFSSGNEGLEVVKILEAASLSIKNGGMKISLKNLTEHQQVDGAIVDESLPDLRAAGKARR